MSERGATKTIDLLALAERCEKATGPDRELDAAVAVALGLPNGRETGWCNKDNGDYYVIDECAKDFTASLDAAMTLVPEGCGYTAQHLGHPAFWTIFVPGGGQYEGHGDTLTLALCAAALRAMEASQ